MTEHADRSPRSATDEERLAARRAVSPRNALLEQLSLLEGDVPGSAAFQAAQRLLPRDAGYPGTQAPPGTYWDQEAGAWAVDHSAAMRLWSPPDGVGLPPREMVDAFLTVYVERTGDDDARRRTDELYAEAERRLADNGGAPESFPVRTRAEAVAVAERYGYGELVTEADLTSTPLGFGMAVWCAAVSALFGLFLLLQSGGTGLALWSGIVLVALAGGILVAGAVVQRRRRPTVPRQLFFFTGGVVLGIDGVLDAYAWPDLELVEADTVSDVEPDHQQVRSGVLLIGPRARADQLAVPSDRRDTVRALAAAGGASFRS